MYPLTIIVWPYRKLRNRPIELECFFTIHWQVTTFEMIAGSSSISFKCIWNKLYSWAALLKFWFQTDLGYENSAGFYMQGRQSLLTFLTIVTRWSRSSSNLNALIGQNLQVSSCGKFMQHLETCFLMAQARVITNTGYIKLTEFCVAICHVFDYPFPLDVQNEYSCY